MFFHHQYSDSTVRGQISTVLSASLFPLASWAAFRQGGASLAPMVFDLAAKESLFFGLEKGLHGQLGSPRLTSPEIDF